MIIYTSPQRGTVFRVAVCARCEQHIQNFDDGDGWHHSDTGHRECAE